MADCDHLPGTERAGSVTGPDLRAQNPTVALAAPGRRLGTARAQSGHRMGTKQKATRLGGFRFAANSLI